MRKEEWICPETGMIAAWWSKDGAYHVCIYESDGELRWQPMQFRSMQQAKDFIKNGVLVANITVPKQK